MCLKKKPRNNIFETQKSTFWTAFKLTVMLIKTELNSADKYA